VTWQGWRNARPLHIVSLALVLLLSSVACGGDSTSTSTVNDLNGPQAYGGRYAGATATGDSEAGASFARWVMDQDPEHRYLTGAVVRGEQTLGVKVQPNITKGDLHDLLVSLTQGMARTFPDRPINVIAYYQSGDKLAEARLDPRTGQISVS